MENIIDKAIEYLQTIKEKNGTVERIEIVNGIDEVPNFECPGLTIKIHNGNFQITIYGSMPQKKI